MTARASEMGDLDVFERKGSGVRASDEILHTYDVTVIAADVDAAVAVAGGWLCDRVRAGWQVTVLVPAGYDERALTILGVRVERVESLVEALRELSSAAVAVDAAALRQDDDLRRDVLRLVDEARVEVTVWGESSLFASDRRFGRVRHRLSSAARAFKTRALLMTGDAAADPAVEEFVGAALWYPPDGD